MRAEEGGIVNRFGLCVSFASLIALGVTNAVLGLPTLERSISIPRPRPVRTPCDMALKGWERGRLELVARGEDPDVVFPRRPGCE